MTIIIDKTFDGKKFAEKYNLDYMDFIIVEGELICPSLPDLKDADLLDCVADIVYSITPAQNTVRLGGSLNIAITGAADETVTLYAYPVDTVPTAEHELDVTLDSNGSDVVSFSAQSIGEYAVRGVAGELASKVVLIKAVG